MNKTMIVSLTRSLLNPLGKTKKLHNESIIVELFQDCLRQFSAPEKMTGSSRWKCPQCKTYRDSCEKYRHLETATYFTDSVKQIIMCRKNPEQQWFLDFKQFVYEGHWRTKINSHVDFPVRGLDMNSFVSGPQAKPYRLYAVSNHFGTLDGGHYTACCRNPNTQKWYKFDDHEVYETTESSVTTSAAYVLYYTSIDLKTPEFKPSFS